MGEKGEETLGRLRKTVENVRIVDTHEHLPQEEERLNVAQVVFMLCYEVECLYSK